MLAEGEAHPIADDEMIEDTHVEECERLLQPPRDELIRLARLEDSRGVVVGEDHGGGIVAQGLPQHLARVDAGAIDGAAEELLERNETVAVVEIETAYLQPPDETRQRKTLNVLNKRKMPSFQPSNSVRKRHRANGKDSTI